jgi:ABC-type methionine transport system permease subunit
MVVVVVVLVRLDTTSSVASKIGNGGVGITAYK